MKITASEIKKGMEIKFGWNQWLKVETISTEYQKNGKELKVFIGSSKQEKPTRRGARDYPTFENKLNDCFTCKASTKINVR